jgi:outer membrane protein assembly factor BamD
MNKRFLGQFIVLVLLLSLANGCTYIDSYFMEPPDDTAQELFENGKDAMAQKEYSKAAEYFQKLKDRYPFSPYTPDAELALGDAFFLNEKYVEAADAYKEFEALHPRHEEMAYVLYQIGMADFRQFASIDRPQKNITEALEYFYKLRELYPGSKYSEEAPRLIKECRKFLADHELYVADFYWSSERYGSAWKRYDHVVKNFPDLPNATQYANQMSKLSYYEYQKQLAEDERVREYGSWKQWFDWL